MAEAYTKNMPGIVSRECGLKPAKYFRDAHTYPCTHAASHVCMHACACGHVHTHI
eukprot:c46609_g1_i1 orf=1-162(-)